MSKLLNLRSNLNRLRFRRQQVRWALAATSLALVLIAALVGLFLMDWLFDMTRLQRILAVALAVGVLYWAYRRFALPWLTIRESEIDVALLVERQQKIIEGDLVAALQFEGAEADRWGSTHLRHAVIDYVAEFGKGLNVLEGLPSSGLARRFLLLLLVAGGVTAVAMAFPRFTQTFMNRLALGNAHYPTRTVVEQVVVYGQTIDLKSAFLSVRIPQGAALQVSARASGELPDGGKVVVQPTNSRVVSTVKLARDGETAPSYSAQLPELVDPLDLEVFLGDARTEPIRIEVISLPVIETSAVVTVPEYAQYASQTSGATSNSRQINVVEGSRVDLHVTCTNKKLREATVSIDGTRYPLQPLEPSDKLSRTWALGSADSPLQAVSQALRYEVQIVDEDGLSLAQPFQGTIRTKPDQPPQITGLAPTRLVVSAARPPIRYGATDDYGLSKLVMHLDITRKEGEPEMRRSLPLKQLDQPILREKLPFKGVYPLDLTEFKLLKGDRLIVTLEAVDYRGKAAGRSGFSEPIVFEVTDDAGILEEIAKPDYKSAEELDELIRKQLTIGGGK